MNETSSVGLGHYLVVLKRQWKTVVAVALLGVFGAVAFLAVVPSKVTASTLVNLNLIITDPFNPSRPASGLLDAATEEQVAGSFVVATNAARSLPGGDSAQALRENVSVTSGTDVTTVRISYSSTSAERARAGADAIANSYLAYRKDQADARKARMIGHLEEQLATLISLDPEGTDRDAPTARMSNIEFQINQLVAIDTTGGAVLTPAAENPVSDQKATLLVSVLLVGLVSGLVLAFVVDMLGRRVRDPHDVERSGAGPALARLSAVNNTFPARGAELEEFRMVRERLFAAAESPLGVLAVIDVVQRKQSTDIAPNLAMVLAQTGSEVRLVLLGESEDYLESLREGLDLLPAGTDSGASIFTSARIPQLTVIQPPAGRSDCGADSMVTEAVHELVNHRTEDTVVVLALPADATAASRLSVSRLAGAALLVVEPHHTKNSDVAACAAEAREVNAQVLGTVLVTRGRRVVRTRPGTHASDRKGLERESVGSRA